MFEVGDIVITLPGLWHEGQDIGDRLAEVISTKGHILINIPEYESNPVKVFRWEIEELIMEDTFNDPIEKDEIDLMLDKWTNPNTSP